ncbi:MAG: thioredoxin fold domain-containing protein [Betaproteobacteria bacterium]|jgi:thioredoxin-related protein|nr:thioredoxin fold domain-containing protein [Betaproteobacteria bacterium]
MRPVARSLRALALATALLVAGPAAQARDAMDHFFHPFLGDLQAELVEAKRAGKQGVMVMYHFEECPSCKWMRENILSREDVQAYYRERFVLIPLDTLGALTITDFAGREWTEKEFARSVPIRGTPTFIFYGLDGKLVATRVGRIKDPVEFMLFADFVASGKYRNMNFAQYRQSKQGKKGS